MENSARTKRQVRAILGSCLDTVAQLKPPRAFAFRRHAARSVAGLLVFTLACGPVVRTEHVTTDRSLTGDNHEFLVSVDRPLTDGSTDLSSKLEILAAGQRLAVNRSNSVEEFEPELENFKLGVDIALAESRVQSRVLAPLAFELGLVTEIPGEDQLLASARNLFDGTSAENGAAAFDAPPVGPDATPADSESPGLTSPPVSQQPANESSIETLVLTKVSATQQQDAGQPAEGDSPDGLAFSPSSAKPANQGVTATGSTQSSAVKDDQGTPETVDTSSTPSSSGKTDVVEPDSTPQPEPGAPQDVDSPTEMDANSATGEGNDSAGNDKGLDDSEDGSHGSTVPGAAKGHSTQPTPSESPIDEPGESGGNANSDIIVPAQENQVETDPGNEPGAKKDDSSVEQVSSPGDSGPPNGGSNKNNKPGPQNDKEDDSTTAETSDDPTPPVIDDSDKKDDDSDSSDADEHGNDNGKGKGQSKGKSSGKNVSAPDVEEPQSGDSKRDVRPEPQQVEQKEPVETDTDHDPTPTTGGNWNRNGSDSDSGTSADENGKGQDKDTDKVESKSKGTSSGDSNTPKTKGPRTDHPETRDGHERGEKADNTQVVAQSDNESANVDHSKKRKSSRGKSKAKGK